MPPTGYSVNIDASNNFVIAKQGSPGLLTFYHGYETKGLNIKTRAVKVEICGGETNTLTDTSVLNVEGPITATDYTIS